MDFRDCLESIVDKVGPGMVAATIMGIDGLPIETIEKEEAFGVDVSSLLVEFSSLIAQVRQSAQVFSAGGLEELAIRSENLMTVIRPVTEDYFLALALMPSASAGKGRYLLRVHAPMLVDELT